MLATESFAATLSLVLYLSAAYVAIYLLYQDLVHPLSGIPGPWLAKISPLYNLYHACKKDIHIDIERLHQRYGPVIRYARNRVCFNSAAAVAQIYGQGSSATKSNAYSAHPFYPELENLFTTTDQSRLPSKRHLVAKGMSDRVVQSLDFSLVEHARIFCVAVLNDAEPRHGSWSLPVDMAKMSMTLLVKYLARTHHIAAFYFSLDVIMEAIYGQSLRLMSRPQGRWLLPAILDANHYMYMTFAWPTLFRSGISRWLQKLLFPRMKNESVRFNRMASQLIEERKMLDVDHDIVTAMQQARDPVNGEPFSPTEIWNEALMLARAGGDSTSTTLSAALFYLAHNSTALHRVQAEVRTTFVTLQDIQPEAVISRCPYLRACIDESLRLAPPTPGCFWRQINGSDTIIAGHKIPRGTEVGVCQYAIHRNEDYFPNSSRFQPERFLRSAGKEREFPTGAFAPFQMGPRACPARGFAYRQIMFLLAYVVWELEFRVTGGEKGSGCGEVEYVLEDTFIAQKRGPVLEFRSRTV